ncbi:MAG: SurA N-terminal domain-containing protein [Chitinophagaceae bacterium]|nr:SurA N-terminal domain-containing protein [Chitinophagaceae bacterium]
MSIIQSIRDKGAKVSVALIALALIGFILTDYFSGKTRAQGGSASDAIGSVNGYNINYTEFEAKVKQMQDYMRQQGSPESAALTQQAQESTWYQEINDLLLKSELNKLDMTIGNTELYDILYGPEAPQDLQRQFIDSATGKFDPVAAKRQIDAMLKNKKTPAAQKESFNRFVEQLNQQRLQQKYIALLANSANQPRWYAEKMNADNAPIAKISFTRALYTDSVFLGTDSTLKVTDDEIAAYLKKHSDQYQMPEEMRTVNYINFSAAASASDSLDAKNNLLKSRADFDSAKNVGEWLAGEGIANYYDGYINGKTIQIANKDSIFKTPVGGIYGPYLDGNTYVLAKVLGVKTMPDTVKVRHILISNNPQDANGQPLPARDSATAYNLTDSLRKAIAGGANFDSLVVNFSDDGGSKATGGVYDNVYSGRMVAPFNDAIFLNPVGYKGIVKSEFGYHYVEILSQKGGGAGYKIAYLSREIVPSQQTDGDALNQATQFAAESRDGVAFDANYEKNLKAKGFTKNVAPDITENTAQTQVGFSREFVRKVYEGELGEVLKPVKVGQNYVVAVVVEINKKGTASLAKVRPAIEPLLKNQKKGEMMKQKIGKITTLEAAAAILKSNVQTVDSVRMSMMNLAGVGREPKVIGAAFNPANSGKVVPEVMIGSSGVFVVRVDSVGTTPVMNGSVADIRKAYYEQNKQATSGQMGPLTALRLIADIKDKRSTRY